MGFAIHLKLGLHTHFSPLHSVPPIPHPLYSFFPLAPVFFASLALLLCPSRFLSSLPPSFPFLSFSSAVLILRLLLRLIPLPYTLPFSFLPSVISSPFLFPNSIRSFFHFFLPLCFLYGNVTSAGWQLAGNTVWQQCELLYPCYFTSLYFPCVEAVALGWHAACFASASRRCLGVLLYIC